LVTQLGWVMCPCLAQGGWGQTLLVPARIFSVVTTTISRDWVDWLLLAVQLLSVVGTTTAALFAYLKIRQAKMQARDSQDALVLG